MLVTPLRQLQLVLSKTNKIGDTKWELNPEARGLGFKECPFLARLKNVAMHALWLIDIRFSHQ